MTGHVLSPLAEAFHPMHYVQTMMYEPVNLAIYNDGVPSLSVPGEFESELLHGIQDEAIDENFPPDAREAAEMEAAETFVEMLALFSILEEREEQTRENFVGFTKRWESRREEGLLSRPRPPKNSVQLVDHNNGGRKTVEGTSNLVTMDSLNSNHKIFSSINRGKQLNEKHTSSKASMKGGRNMGKTQRRTVQQPRKHN